MFTGIIEETGKLRSLRRVQNGAVISVSARIVLSGMKTGDSIAVNGVCLTVICIEADAFACDLSSETLERTTFNKSREGTIVNLERPLSVGARMGGHFVQGHVDAVGQLDMVTPSGAGAVIRIEYPSEVQRYLVHKGSIAVDGISLTIASLDQDYFTVAVIPHTLQASNLGLLRKGESVNLEVDILGKYVERLLQSGTPQNKSSGWSLEYLREQGY